jgi:hypothetical protein
MIIIISIYKYFYFFNTCLLFFFTFIGGLLNELNGIGADVFTLDDSFKDLLNGLIDDLLFCLTGDLGDFLDVLLGDVIIDLDLTGDLLGYLVEDILGDNLEVFLPDFISVDAFVALSNFFFNFSLIFLYASVGLEPKNIFFNSFFEFCFFVNSDQTLFLTWVDIAFDIFY